MPQKEIRIRDSGGATIGSIIFDEKPPSIPVIRTAQGINITIPATVELEWMNRQEPQATLTNLRANIYCKERSGSEMYLCHIRDEEYYEAASPRSISPANFIWMDALRGLVLIEVTRSGGQPDLDIDVRGELGYIINCAETQAPGDNRIFVNPLRYAIRTAPRVRLVERITVSYSVEIWEAMVQSALGLMKDDPYMLSLPLHSFLQRRS
jgi:hypothetical protein